MAELTAYQRRQKAKPETVNTAVEKRLPFAQYEYVQVTFPAVADSDLVIGHSLDVIDPDDTQWEVVSLEAPQAIGLPPVIYRDGRSTQTAWGRSYIVLRSNTPYLVAVLRLSTRPSGFALRQVNGSASRLTATQNLSLTGSYTERGRSLAMGEWGAVTFSAGNFTASAGNWTVDSGDVTINRYAMVGKTLFWNLRVENTDVSATPTFLRVTLPGGLTCAYASTSRASRAIDNGTELSDVVVTTGATETYVQCWRTGGAAWSTTAADNTLIHFNIAIEVQ